nr:M90 family metallopeptidase [Luteimonas sp. BDR2-5]
MIRRLFAGTPPAPDPVSWQAVRTRLPWLRTLDDGAPSDEGSSVDVRPGSREAALQALAARFLQHKTITPIGDLVLDDSDRLLLAALCCLPLLEFGEEGLHGWSQLIVYPDAFRVNRTHVDAAGVMHEWDDELIGEAWESGPLVLSWADVQADIAEPDAGFCVAVHEMAHKLDALDGLLDGTPPLPRHWQQAWARDFQRAYDGFVAEVEAGRATTIDPYAAEAPEEFFAVCSEYHFSAPQVLQAAFPAVAAHLAKFYGRPPLA